jgi:hypothetical protein
MRAHVWVLQMEGIMEVVPTPLINTTLIDVDLQSTHTKTLIGWFTISD